ncbi:MAG: macro domain-containing protein [Candidatus Puniceispirillaceae bacterium]
MRVIIADHQKRVFNAVQEYHPTFEIELGSPLAFDIDAVVSPANTAGIMNGGFDAALRRFFGITLEYRVRMRIKDNPISVGEAFAIQTVHPRIKWLIVSPTVSIAADGLSGVPSVAYTCGYNSVIAAHKAGASVLGMTGLGTGAGGLSVRDAVRNQCDGIEDALNDIRHQTYD